MSIRAGMPERERYWTRRELTVHLRVADAHGQEVGCLVGIGVKGATLLHKQPLGTSVPLPLQVELPAPLESDSPLPLACEVRWTHPATEGPGSLYSGLEFVEMTPERIAVLGKIFDAFTRVG